MSRPRKNPEFITKKCEGCNKDFTISSRKYRQRFCNKSCAQNSSSVQEKIKNSQLITYRENYGVDHPMKTESVVERFSKTMLSTYGVRHALHKPVLLEKSKNTKLKKYGDENFNNVELRKKTCLIKYGVDNPRKCEHINKKITQTIQKNHFDYLKNYCNSKNITLLFGLEDYVGYDFKNKYSFKCNVCNKTFVSDVYKPAHIFCEVCNPLDHNTIEDELFKFVTSIIPQNVVVKRNDRTILMGKELDIFIPFKNLAIELNGLYWHSENGRNINKFYHLNKYKSCMFHGIKLIHIFENEWNYKKDIVKSIIRNHLGCIDTKIYARNCSVRVITETEKSNFLEMNHMQNNDRSSIKIGLFYNNELVSVMTFGKSRFDKSIQFEMYRYCNKINTSVTGGASKLFGFFVKNYSPESIVSYNDRRYFDGDLYKTLGFLFKSVTPPNYFYITPDYKFLYGRQSYQKHKLVSILEKFSPELSEWENMKQNGFDRIWDCGNGKWIWNKT